MPIYKRILGIDPGLATIGWGLIENNKAKNQLSLIKYGVISTPAKQDLTERLKTIAKNLEKIIKSAKPDAIAVEKLFFCKNIKTALDVGHARGVILLTACQCRVPVKEFTPLQIKQSVAGYGKADKQQIQIMVKCLLKMKNIPKPDDAADALAAACASASFLNSQLYENR